ncbi:response regulator transcription factor [Limnobacter litoralis]|uniref:DNA-binding response regulator n=1 Tax=Limnobacter litoralis TaxID=481366 RepID=A0ABQ5YPY1_9BURK|nr:DNA-binding response regulator [Limnobacter litoralis]GLR24988.1 DNA-binding response regulator [Limnobacter litoralis]
MNNTIEQRRDVVLVVDDSPDALSLINDTLEAAGMDVLVALEGRQALTIMRRIRPDLVLMDAVMPNMDGFETCKAIKADSKLAAVPVIFMTGLNEIGDVVKGLESGGVDYLVKPVRPGELLARMKVHLSNARLTHSAQSALDHAGQHLSMFNALGHLQWATPLAYALLEEAGASSAWQMQTLAPKLRAWLAPGPALHSELRIDGPVKGLLMRFQGLSESGQALFRLCEGNRPDEAGLLKQRLGLTERESEVLNWVANGKTNREVAEILGMSPRTVNKHLEQVFSKLGVENRTAAAGIALATLAKAIA